MMQFVAGTVFGVVISTVGITGIANMADQGINATKVIVQEQAQKAPNHEERIAQLRREIELEQSRSK